MDTYGVRLGMPTASRDKTKRNKMKYLEKIEHIYAKQKAFEDWKELLKLKEKAEKDPKYIILFENKKEQYKRKYKKWTIK